MNKWMTLGIGIFIIAVLALIALFVLPSPTRAPTKEPTTFAECVAAGYPVVESYPRQCNTPSGKGFTEDIGNAIEKQDLIRVTSPMPGDSIASPMTVSGEARGTWYFEASFPYELRTASGTVIAQGPVQASGDWMTTEFVPFSVDISFPAQPKGSTGTLLLKKDNPSGLPANEDALTIPVVF
jgi:hypothetical protein